MKECYCYSWLGIDHRKKNKDNIVVKTGKVTVLLTNNLLGIEQMIVI